MWIAWTAAVSRIPGSPFPTKTAPTPFCPDGRWDIDASFDEKAGKCGLLEIDGGVELCWGITEYGRHDYTVSYDIGGLAGAYSDADGFNYRFIDPDQSIFPTSPASPSAWRTVRP